MTNEVTTTIKMPKETLIKIKSLAVEKGTSQKNIINDLINKGLKTTENKEGKKKAREIQMPFTDSNKKGSLKNIIGIAEVDNAEDIDVNELIDNIHYKKELY
ncbi:MAG: hypothetical protein KO202_06105 [Methanobacteriaceae archaeon]|jgi:predicted DNA-binding protein|nr:hypothetical protein [Methanobacteriaceae archaeon]